MLEASKVIVKAAPHTLTTFFDVIYFFLMIHLIIDYDSINKNRLHFSDLTWQQSVSVNSFHYFAYPLYHILKIMNSP